MSRNGNYTNPHDLIQLRRRGGVLLSIGEIVFEPLRNRSPQSGQQFGEGGVVWCIVTFEELGRPLFHGRVNSTFGFAEAFRFFVTHCLTEKAFLRVVSANKAHTFIGSSRSIRKLRDYISMLLS